MLVVGTHGRLRDYMQEVIQCTGGKDGAILSFGSDSGMPQHLAAELIQNMQQAQRSMSPSSPGGRSSSPRRLNCLPQRTTQVRGTVLE